MDVVVVVVVQHVVDGLYSIFCTPTPRPDVVDCCTASSTSTFIYCSCLFSLPVWWIKMNLNRTNGVWA